MRSAAGRVPRLDATVNGNHGKGVRPLVGQGKGTAGDIASTADGAAAGCDMAWFLANSVVDFSGQP